MRRSRTCAALLCSLVGIGTACAQTAQAAPANAVCTFADGQQMSLRYTRPSGSGKQKLPMGQVWAPGDSPMDLFTQVGLSTGNSEIPIGAYRVYIIPDKKSWTLVINKNVAAGSKYDQQQDLVRVPMQIGHLGTAVSFEASFAHMAPKQCNLRIYYGKIGTWAEFTEK